MRYVWLMLERFYSTKSIPVNYIILEKINNENVKKNIKVLNWEAENIKSNNESAISKRPEK